jgi:plasmid stabilization system protein ParE
MSKVELTKAARADLQQIQEHIAQDSTTTARRIVRELRAAMERLADIAGKGRLRVDLADEPLRI